MENILNKKSNCKITINPHGHSTGELSNQFLTDFSSNSIYSSMYCLGSKFVCIVQQDAFGFLTL